MKNRVKSHNRLAKLTSLVLTAAMSVTLVPNIVGTKEVKADDSGIGLEPLDYVMLGTSKMASPAEPNRGKVWDGSYVYFGNYGEGENKENHGTVFSS